MAKNDNQVVSTETVDVAELRAQIEAELKAQFEAEAKEFTEKETAKRKRLEEKLKNTEKNLEAQLRAEEKSLKAQLEEFPKVPIEIPEDQNNPDDVVPVGWNGIIYAIPRGIPLEVPKPIYDIWKDSHKRTQEVNKRIRESTKKEIEIL